MILVNVTAHEPIDRPGRRPLTRLVKTIPLEWKGSPEKLKLSGSRGLMTAVLSPAIGDL